MVDLKQQLIDKIQLTTDKIKLEEIYRLLEIEFDEQEVYMLSAEQKSAVKEAQKQIENGEFLSDEQANKEVEEWLKKIVWSVRAQQDRLEILEYWIK